MLTQAVGGNGEVWSLRRRRAPPVCGARAPPAVWAHLAFQVVETYWVDEAFSADGAFSVDCAFSVPHAPGGGANNGRQC